MARLPRYYLPDQPQHLIQRGNNRNLIFLKEGDYLFYLECLSEAVEQHGCDVHAYVLMTNHVHLLVTPHHKDSIPKTLQSVGRRYVQHFNHTNRRTGTLWEGRYRATLIESERYLLTCYRYIELNPVRAKMVKHPQEYLWSSYQYHAKGRADGLIKDHELYLALGRTAKKRQESYRALFKNYLGQGELEVIREATNKAWVLGNDRFKKEIAKGAKRRLEPLPKGRPRKVFAN